MTKASIVLVSCLLLLLLSCQKKEWIDKRYNAEAVMNVSIIWKAEQSLYSYKEQEEELSILAYKFSEEGFLRNSLRFGKLKFELGKQVFTERLLEEDKIYMIKSLSDGDVIGGRHKLLLLDNFESFVDIHKISDDSSFMEGVFQVALVVDSSTIVTDVEALPDTILFTDGVFKAKRWKPE